MANTVANLVIDVTANTKSLGADLAKGKASVDNFAQNAIKSLQQIAALVGGGLGIKALIGDFNDSIDRIDAMGASAQKFGISVEAFQKLQFQAEQADVSVESLGGALKFMLKNVEEAAKAGTPLNALFTQLGLSAEYLKTLSPDKQFYEIARALDKVTNQNEFASKGTQIFGRAFLEVGNLIRSDLDSTGKRFENLKTTISTTQANAVSDLDNTQKAVSKIWTGFKDNTAAEIAPAFDALLMNIEAYNAAQGGMKASAMATASFVIKAVGGIAEAYRFLFERMQEVIALGDVLATPVRAVGATAAGLSSQVQNAWAGLMGNELPFPTITQDQKHENWLQATVPDRVRNVVNGTTNIGQGNTPFIDSTIKALNEEFMRTSQGAQQLSENLGKAAASFGTISNGAGRTMSIGTPPPPQQVDVNTTVTVKVSDNLLNVIDQRVEKKMNDAARGTSR